MRFFLTVQLHQKVTISFIYIFLCLSRLYSRDEAHLYIATYYFQASAPWNKIIVSDITEKSADHRDPMYTLQGIKQ